MKAMKEKIRSRRGATLVMAMVLIAMCSIVTAAILTAANTAARAVSSQTDHQQAYLSVESAANVLNSQVCGNSCEYSTTDYYNRNYSYYYGSYYYKATGDSTSTETKFAVDWLNDLYTKLKEKNGSTFTKTMTVEAKGIDPVTVIITATRDDSKVNNVTMVAELRAGEDTGDSYSMTMTFEGTLKHTEPDEDEYMPVSPGGTTITLPDEVTRYRWVGCKKQNKNKTESVSEYWLEAANSGSAENIQKAKIIEDNEYWDSYSVDGSYQPVLEIKVTKQNKNQYVSNTIKDLTTISNDYKNSDAKNATVPSYVSGTASSTMTSPSTKYYYSVYGIYESQKEGTYFLLAETWKRNEGVDAKQTIATTEMLYSQTTSDSLTWNSTAAMQ